MLLVMKIVEKEGREEKSERRRQGRRMELKGNTIAGGLAVSDTTGSQRCLV
jgi:hypothetical protein